MKLQYNGATKRNQNSWAAFTLIECLVVLFILGIMILLPVMAFDRWQQELKIQLFFDQLEKNIQRTQHTAITLNKETFVELHGQYRQIFFKRYDPGVEAFIAVQTLPEQLDASRQHTKITFQPSSGNSGDLKRLAFYRGDQKKTYVYQFQMGSGQYEKKVE